MSDESTWSLTIEFTGLFVLTTTERGRFVAQLLDDAEHAPVLTCRALDLLASHDCGPVHKVTDLQADGSTLSLFPIRRGAIMSVVVQDSGFGRRNSRRVILESPVSQLADLRGYFGGQQCPIEHDNPVFMFGSGMLSAGRFDDTLIFEITIDQQPVYQGPLALSLVYTIPDIPSQSYVALDLHPGTLLVSAGGNNVSLGISNLPVVQVRDKDTVHFAEYARLLGSDADVMATVHHKGHFIDDPVHCVPARFV